MANNEKGIPVGTASFDGGFTKKAGAADSKCLEDTLQDLGPSGKISIAKKGDGCELSANVDEADDVKVPVTENGSNTTEELQTGKFTASAPLNSAKWTAHAVVDAVDSDGEPATVTIDGDVQGMKMTDCTTVPEGDFKVTNIVATMKGK
ncbi:hypothetical protein [Nocardia suismassiliense]|uniref:hypothetical protein n=1 Tax=Nocardia suismassiliense TaxID=2077092 RepID=UPI00131F07F0|nr:hypothetical protein [Nocardia suismassiliense]